MSAYMLLEFHTHLTYETAYYQCLIRGRRLCFGQELCPDRRSLAVSLGGATVGDKWSPIEDRVNSWMQIGKGSAGTGGGGTGTCSVQSWTEPLFADVFHVYCCRSVAVSCDAQPWCGPLVRDLPASHDHETVGLRFFIYDLPGQFHTDLVAEMELRTQMVGSECDYMRSPCTEAAWVQADWQGMRPASTYSQARTRGAEVIILRRLLASSLRVRDPHIADVFVVPYLAGLDCWLSGNHPECDTAFGQDKLVSLFSHLHYYNSATRGRHLFLGSADIHSLPYVIQQQPLLLSLGASSRGHPGHIIVPPAVTEAEFQPGISESRTLPLQERDILFFVAHTPNNVARFLFQSDLEEFDLAMSETDRMTQYGRSGRIVIIDLKRGYGGLLNPHAPSNRIASMQRAVFCPAPPGENPTAGNKRLYDAILAGCLPVVVAYWTAWGSGVSWWRHNGPPVEWSQPFPRRIDWQRLVVEVPEKTLISNENFVPGILRIPTAVLEDKHRYLLEVRWRLRYDLTGDNKDAIGVILDGLQAALPSLSSFQVAPLRSERATVCDLHPLKVRVSRGLENAEKQWLHGFGEVSCRPTAIWHPPAKDMAIRRSRPYDPQPVVVEQFKTVVTYYSKRKDFFLDVMGLESWEIPLEEEAAFLAQYPLAVCSHGERWAKACHDQRTSDSFFVCHMTADEVELPNTTCHLLPERPSELVRQGPRQLGSDILSWEVVTWSCNASSLDWVRLVDEWERAWQLNMPATSSLRIIVYEVCAPDALHRNLAGRGNVTEAQSLVQHLLAAKYMQQQGRQAADAMLLVPNLLDSDLSKNCGMRPSHVVGHLAAMLEKYQSSGSPAGDGSKESNWLVARGILNNVVEPPNIWRHFGLGRQMPFSDVFDRTHGKFLAFSTKLLQKIMLTHFESSVLSESPPHWHGVLEALFVLLVQGTNDIEWNPDLSDIAGGCVAT